MLDALNLMAQTDGGVALAGALGTVGNYLLIFLGFSLVIFVHELGHFFAAKLCRVRVDKFAIGFGRELFGFTKGETRYAFNILPLGGYVKMLGQEDFTVDKSGEWKVKDDPRAFTNKPVGQRMFIVSAGVFMNLVFAAVAFAIVFMMGWISIPAQIGQVIPGMPADQAGLRVGDKILKVNKQSISDHSDLQAAIILADPDQPLNVTYQRKDPVSGEWKTDQASIMPEMSPDNNVLRIGISPPRTNEVAFALNEPISPSDQELKTGDKIVAIDGRPTESFYEVADMLANARGDWATLSIERPLGERAVTHDPRVEPSEITRLELPWRARLLFKATSEQSGHLLGFVPRQRVLQVTEGSRAQEAGVRDGDVIARFGGQVAPRLEEINKIRRDNSERDIRITVDRPGEGEISMALRPNVSGVFRKGSPTDGLVLGSQENDQLVVADIVTKVTDTISTPAAALKDLMPRGSIITRVDDRPVATWRDLTRVFTESAGKNVSVSWSFKGNKEQSAEIYIPHTIGTTFDLPGARQIISINGVARKEVEIDGTRRTLQADNWRGASEILKDSIGEAAVIVYQNNLADKPETVTIEKVTPEMLDTWTLRVDYVIDNMVTWHTTTLIKETNPIAASMIGLRKTWYFIEQVYLTMQRMIFTRSMSMDQVSGPVGILQLGSQVAAAGIPQLMYFLALISANLAVINFLPLPIMDGGIFVFLLIEKIKGSPLSMRIQVATQLIGLALIIGIFLFVTFQDIQKLAG